MVQKNKLEGSSPFIVANGNIVNWILLQIRMRNLLTFMYTV